MGPIVALDIETKSLTDNKDHALIPHLSKITCVGIWCPEFQVVFRDLIDLERFIEGNPDISYVGHNFAFDLKHLHQKGIDLRDKWAHDTRLMAHNCFEKPTEEYLESYEAARKLENKKLPVGYSHRKAGQQSLKTLAPYFLDAPPFWEDPTNHDSDEYVLKDCEYTYRLYDMFNKRLRAEGNYKFYRTWAMPRARTVLDAEIAGISIDLTLMDKMREEAEIKAIEAKGKLDRRWAFSYKDYYDLQVKEVQDNYNQKLIKALEKAGNKEKCKQRYLKLEKLAIDKLETKINLNSPLQLTWLLKESLELDITDFSGKESTGIEVLEKLAATGQEDVKTFIEYRKQNKLVTAFFPTYKELQDGGALKPSFNFCGTRTGRLSSSEPNLQQVPGDLHKLFKARPGYQLITRDQSYIEPRLIAFYTQDPVLCDLIMTGGNFHSRNANIMLGLDCPEEEIKDRFPEERAVAKTCGLALMYGAGARRIMMTAQKAGYNWSFDKCREIYQNFKATYRHVFEFKEDLDSVARREPIENIVGRKHLYTNRQADIYMKAFNTLIQSSASDLVIDSAYKIMNEFNKLQIDGRVLLFVHDELVIEVCKTQIKQAETVIEQCMTSYKLPTKFGDIPLEIEGTTGNYWEK